MRTENPSHNNPPSACAAEAAFSFREKAALRSARTAPRGNSRVGSAWRVEGGAAAREAATEQRACGA